jgi:uncharacterized protein (TIGR02996 family)
MNERTALLADVCEHPGDDGPRLVYADWLEDHGEGAFAEFIRIQIDLANLPEDDPRRPALLKRERRLLPARRAAWEGERPAFAAGKCDFVRGFAVPRIKEPVAAFVKRRPGDFSSYPLWHVTLTGLANAPDRLDQVAALVDCPNLGRAAGLFLTANSIGASGARRLAECPYLGNVTALGLRRNWMGEEGVEALAESASWPRLRQLDLGGNRIDADGVVVLARAPLLANVAELDLEFNWIDDYGARALAASPRLGRLRKLVLERNRIGDPGAEMLAGASWARGLKELTLANQLGDAGAKALAESPHLEGIEVLNVSENSRITEAGAALLRERFGRRVILPSRLRVGG